MLLRQSLTAVAVALSPLMLSLSAFAETAPLDVPDVHQGEVETGSETMGSFDASDEGPAASSDVVFSTCTTDADCQNSDICVDGYCRYQAECTSDAQCAAEDECVYGQCFAKGLYCNDQSDCGNFANCEPGPGSLGKCTVDPDTVPTDAACESVCTNAASCASLSEVDCRLACNYAAANGQSAQVEALAACLVGKHCDQITADCDIGEGSVLLPGVFTPNPDVPSVDGDAEASSDASNDASSNALELATDADKGGCVGGSGNSLPMSLVLTLLALFAVTRSRQRAVKNP